MAANQFGISREINWAMFDLGTRWILAQIAVTFPVF